MSSITYYFLMVAFVFCMNNFSVADDTTEKANQADKSNQYTLKEAFRDHFYVGAAVSDYQISGKDKKVKEVIKSQFNTITPENCMKWNTIHPKPDFYDFDQADRFVEFGEKNNMFMVGHIFIDWTQVPDWVFRDSQGKQVDRDTLLKRVQEHITTILGHYKGRIPAWHVVNEAIGRDGKMRQCKWLDIIGDDYVVKAFEYAHKADPNVELYYNGHDILTKEATDSIVQLAGDIKKSGGRIDGIGVQAHWALDNPSIETVEEGIANLARAGVKIMITEMDITVLPRASGDSAHKLNPYRDGLPDEIGEKLAARYAELFTVFCKHDDKIERVNFWGVDDGQSWLNNWPIRGRTDFPLLFDRSREPKAAFFAVIKTAER